MIKYKIEYVYLLLVLCTCNNKEDPVSLDLRSITNNNPNISVDNQPPVAHVDLDFELENYSVSLRKQ